MVSRKYTKDYRLSETPLPNGRMKTQAIYIGEHYYFTAPPNALHRLRTACLTLMATCWIAFIGALLPRSHASSLMVVVLPHVCCLMPLCYLSESVWILWRAPVPLTHSQADKVSKGLPTRSLLCLLFSAAAFLGFAVTLALSPESALPGDVVFGGFEALLTTASALIFARRSLAGTTRTEPDETPK